MYEDIQINKHTRIHLLTDMYRYLHLHNCTNAPKKYMRVHHTHMHIYILHAHFLKCTITNTRTDLIMRSPTHPLTHPLTHPFIHSLIPSFPHSLAHIFHIFQLLLSLLVTNMHTQAHSCLLMGIHTHTQLHVHID